ncbi:hypothetical protein C6P40_004412 [Pichia californica]|uniref:Phosphomutase n=1 Tax=Pichia californica TaxID=460514 RepID=A0A9P6WQ25_9ASCO|nr:hypothetical protein C6P42_005290 [[Candida] californica]KAG0691161.1 hypothetical protein C6P40_004412 [[Candida] californica]
MSLIEVNACDKLDAIVPDEEYILYNEKLNKRNPEWSFSIVPGFFKQSAPETDDLTYNSFDDHLGLSDGLTWPSLVAKLDELNKSSDPSKERYKLIFSARHGQGYHNLAVQIFGIDEWNNHYSHLEGATTPDGIKLNWAPDPFLTEKGQNQAKLMNATLKKEIKDFNCPLPTKLFSSPFTRSCQTLYITMDGICMNNKIEDSEKPLIAPSRLTPLIKEDLRETIGEHLCDKRSDKSTIEKRLNGWDFRFENGFQHDDIYYKDDWREPIHEQALRANSFLQDVFSNDEYVNDQIVYSTSHSGEMKALIIATGHRQYAVPTAGMIPMLIKAVKN